MVLANHTTYSKNESMLTLVRTLLQLLVVSCLLYDVKNGDGQVGVGEGERLRVGCVRLPNQQPVGRNRVHEIVWLKLSLEPCTGIKDTKGVSCGQRTEGRQRGERGESARFVGVRGWTGEPRDRGGAVLSVGMYVLKR